MADRIQLRRDTKANWELINPVLTSGEPGFVEDTMDLKIGDGVNTWNDLPYVAQQSLITTLASLQVRFNTHQLDKAKYAVFLLEYTQSIENNTNVSLSVSQKVSYNEEDFCEWDSANNGIKIIKSGLYEVYMGVVFANNSVGYRRINFTSENNSYSMSPAVSGTVHYLSSSGFKYVAASPHTIVMMVRQNSGAALDIIPGDTKVVIRKVV